MNSAYRKMLRNQERASATLGLCGAAIVAIVAIAAAVAFIHLIATMPSGWWLPVAQRPFGGAL
jgi:hypothetical protein